MDGTYTTTATAREYETKCTHYVEVSHDFPCRLSLTQLRIAVRRGLAREYFKCYAFERQGLCEKITPHRNLARYIIDSKTIYT